MGRGRLGNGHCHRCNSEEGGCPCELLGTGEACHGGRVATAELAAADRLILDDVGLRARQLRDLGMRRVVECTDATVATLLSRDRTLRPYCTRIGDRHLLLAPNGEAKVRTALRKLGYALGLEA